MFYFQLRIIVEASKTTCKNKNDKQKIVTWFSTWDSVAAKSSTLVTWAEYSKTFFSHFSKLCCEVVKFRYANKEHSVTVKISL